MPFNYPRSGLNNVGEYQTSGLPWVSSSSATDTPSLINFPLVTNQITFKATAGIVRFGFTQNGVNGSNFFTLAPSSSLTLDVRCKQLWVRSNTVGTASYELVAGLTTIPWKDFPVLTGSATYNSGTVAFVYGYGLPQTPGSGSGLG